MTPNETPPPAVEVKTTGDIPVDLRSSLWDRYVAAFGRETALKRLSVRMARHTTVDPVSGCHPWTGFKGQEGYGKINLRLIRERGGTTSAHRVAYALAKGDIPAGLQIDHLCRRRDCCNPDHLEAVTARENTLRGDTSSAARAKQTHCLRGHPFDRVNTRISSEGTRHCKACHAMKRREWRAARAAAKSPGDAAIARAEGRS